ncbi:MAG TPA: right-handed parallel beta-helix repeat-containing protein [Candidatus Binataceae bacterium]|nr:right-handed parallel beta-helix repeat-containing protein [Candidatus Binataceae bacterium]
MRKNLPMIVRGRPHLRARLIVGVLNAIGLALILGATLAIPKVAFSQPPIAGTTCQKITKPGLYEIDNILIASSPAAGDCIVITAPNVSLNLNGFDLLGATRAVGIHVMKTAAKAVIEGNGSTIKTFGVGIQIDAAGALADNFTVNKNTDAGVVINHTQQAQLSNFSSTDNLNDGVRIVGGGFNGLQMTSISGNGRYGVWVEGSSNNSVGNFDISKNALVGIYVGCSQAGPRAACLRGVGQSNYNHLFSGTINDSGIQQYGVAIDLGDNFNRVVNVYARFDSQVDLLDENPDCASNYWFAEPIIGVVTPQTCIN